MDRREQINTWLLAAAVLVIGLQSLLVMGLIASWMPAVYTDEVADIFLRGRPYFFREYDLFIFRAFIFLNILLTFAAAFFLKHRLREERLTKTLVRFLSVAGPLAMLGFWAAFNKIVNGSPFALGWNAGLFWPPPQIPQLPFFLPLRFGAVAAFTLSFIVPIGSMAVLLHAIENKMKRCVGLAVAGLALFFVYARYPFTGVLLLVSLPLLFALLLWQVGKKPWRPSSRNAASVLCGMQAAVLCVWAQEQMRMPVAPANFSMAVYGIFILAASACYSAMVFWRLRVPWAVVVFQLTLVSLMALAWFKLVVYDYRADLARFWFKALGILTIAQPLLWGFSRRVWPFVSGVCRRLGEYRGGGLVEMLVLGAIAGAVYVPDIEAMCAHIFMGEYMHHTDAFVMGPAWAVAHGAVINVDVHTNYGIGLIPLFIGLMNMQGGISYEHLFTAVVGICTVYFMLVYLFFRRWLGGRLLALSCWMMAFKAQIAFELAYPFVFTYPQSTVARQWPDILWMIFMLAFMDTGKRRWLVMASLSAGLTLWYMPSIGCYMVIAHAVMSVMAAWTALRGRERFWGCLWPPALAVGSAAVLLFATCGAWVFRPVFWHNAMDAVRVFMLTDAVPLTAALTHKQFLHSIVLGIIVLVYAGTIVKVGLDFLRDNGSSLRAYGPIGPEARRDWLALGLSIYGLGLLEHYVVFSMGNHYYTKTVPFFIVLFHWLSKGLVLLPRAWGRRAVGSITGLAFVALVTNHSFISYPNAWNISANPLVDRRVARPLPDGRPYFYHKDRFTVAPQMQFPVNSLGNTDEGLVTENDFKDHKELIQAYRRDSDFSVDAALIASLTLPSQKVPLISSYEVRILMQARRRPFFFFCPLLATRAMRVRSLPAPADSLDTKQDVHRTIAGLEQAKPPFIFIEKIMNSDRIPSAYEQSMPGFMALLRYVKANYVPYQEGYYLLAMKRK